MGMNTKARELADWRKEALELATLVNSYAGSPELWRDIQDSAKRLLKALASPETRQEMPSEQTKGGDASCPETFTTPA